MLPFDTAAAGAMRALSLMKHKSQRLTAVMTQALKRTLYDAVFTSKSLKSNCNNIMMKPGIRATSYTTELGLIADQNMFMRRNIHYMGKSTVVEKASGGTLPKKYAGTQTLCDR